MNQEIDLGSYSADAGLRLVWLPGYVLNIVSDEDGVIVSGNPQGLRCFAEHLLMLATEDVPAGVHAPTEPGMELEDDSAPLTVEKTADRG